MHIRVIYAEYDLIILQLNVTKHCIYYLCILSAYMQTDIAMVVKRGEKKKKSEKIFMA